MVRATSSSAFGWKPKGVSRKMALSRGWPARAVSCLWTDVMVGLISPEPKIAIRRGGRASWRSIPEMLRRSYARVRVHDQAGVLHHPAARYVARGVLALLAGGARPDRTPDSRAARVMTWSRPSRSPARRCVPARGLLPPRPTPHGDGSRSAL